MSPRLGLAFCGVVAASLAPHSQSWPPVHPLDEQLGAAATPFPELPAVCAGPPATEEEYETCIGTMYRVDRIRQSVNRRFRRCRVENSHYTSKDCAVSYYSSMRSPVRGAIDEGFVQACPEAGGKTMKELYALAKLATAEDIECIMQVSMQLSRVVDCESNALGRELYHAIDQQGNVQLLMAARDNGSSLEIQADLAIKYRNWAKNFMKDVLMIGVMHNVWGADILYLREEKLFGLARGRTREFQIVRTCGKLGFHNCSTAALTAHQEMLIYSRILADATRTNKKIDKALTWTCPQPRPTCHSLHSWCVLGYTVVVPAAAYQLCPMNEFWGWLYVGMILLVWRIVTVKLDYMLDLGIQEMLERRLGQFKVWAQWYTAFLFIMWWEFFLSFRNIWRYDYCHDSSCGGLQVPSGKEMATSLWLLGSFAPLATIIALTIVSVHVVQTGRELSRKEADLWQGDATIIVLLLPSFFALMSVAAFSRMWQLTYGDHLSGSREDYIALFKSDLSLAIFVEILTLYEFARLATDHLCDQLEEELEAQEEEEKPVQTSAFFPAGNLSKLLPCVTPKPTMYWLAMNAVYLCVILGVIQCALQVLSLVACRRLQLDQNPFLPAVPVSVDTVCGTGSTDHWTMIFCRSSAFLLTVDKLASLAMMLTAYNMYFVCGLPAVEMRLPKANLKFNGTRIVVMLAQIQGKILIPELTLDAAFSSQGNLVSLLLGVDGYHTALMHVILTQYELLVIVVIHAIIWSEWRPWRKARDAHYLLVS